MFHVLHDSLLSYSFFDLSLCLDVERIGVERLDRASPLQFCGNVLFLHLPHQRGESRGVMFDRICQLGLGLSCREVNARGRMEVEKRTHLSKLGQQLRIAQYLQSHHLRILWRFSTRNE